LDRKGRFLGIIADVKCGPGALEEGDFHAFLIPMRRRTVRFSIVTRHHPLWKRHPEVSSPEVAERRGLPPLYDTMTYMTD